MAVEMAAFFTELLDGFLKPDFLKTVHKKFHYGEEQLETLMAVAGEMLPIIRKEAFWERGAERSYGGEQGEPGMVCEEVVMSLGKGLDDLQEDYSRKGMLLESYMLETLASELLLRGYSAYNQYVRMEGKWHVARYHFPGSEEELPLESLPEILEGLSPQVVCNKAFCMQPKKSVVFIAELTQDATRVCEGICIGCGSADCPNRVKTDSPEGQLGARSMDMPLSYGYSRIFGRF